MVDTRNSKVFEIPKFATKLLTYSHQKVQNSWFPFPPVLFFSLDLFNASFVALIVLSEQSNREREEGSAHIWFERSPKINFPDFHIFAPRDTRITSAKCSFLDQEIASTECTGWVKDSGLSCVQFPASSKQGYWDPNNFRANRVDCNLTTTLTQWNNTEDMLIGWDLVNAHPAGDNSLGPIWVRPTELSWILVTKRQWWSKDFQGIFWDRFLEYHETEAIPGRYRIQTVIDKFFVEHIDYGTHLTGWHDVAAIGGFAFFTYILHTIVMFVVSFALTNDSHFLNPASGYAKV